MKCEEKQARVGSGIVELASVIPVKAAWIHVATKATIITNKISRCDYTYVV